MLASNIEDALAGVSLHFGSCSLRNWRHLRTFRSSPRQDCISV